MQARWIVALTMAAAIPAAPPAKPTLTDARCPKPPTASATVVGFRHMRSKLIATAGSPNHRALDLIASEDDETQLISGKLAYGKLDKDIDDEEAEIFACQDNGNWKSLGVVRTDVLGLREASRVDSVAHTNVSAERTASAPPASSSTIHTTRSKRAASSLRWTRSPMNRPGTIASVITPPASATERV